MGYLLVIVKPCLVLRDHAVTMDVVPLSYVEPHLFTGDCASIEQDIQAQSVCLPVAKITIDAPFGTHETEAAVYRSLPPHAVSLPFSNRFDQILREKGIVFMEWMGPLLTRKNYRELGTKAAVESNEDYRESRRGRRWKLATTPFPNAAFPPLRRLR